MRTIKAKIISLVLICLLPSVFIISIVSIFYSRTVVANSSSIIMNLLCKEKSESINTLLSKMEQSVDTLANYVTSHLPSPKELFVSAKVANNFAESMLDFSVSAAQSTNGVLSVYLRYNPELTTSKGGFFYVRDEGQDTFHAERPTDLSRYSKDLPQVSWFHMPAQEKKAVWLPPYKNYTLTSHLISYVVPLYAQEQFIGVLGMDLDFSLVKKIVDETSVYQTGYAFLTDDTAHIVSHKEISPGTSLLGYNNGEFRSMAEALQGSEQQERLISYTYSGIQKDMAFRPLINDMRFVLCAPTAEIYQNANTLLANLTLLSLVVLALSICPAFIFSKRLVRPLLELNSAAEKIAQGDLSVSITHKSEDEVGTLAENFRKTVSHLKSYTDSLNDLAYRDTPTGVHNKTAYLEAVEKLDRDIVSGTAAFSVVIFDLNDLKKVNDTYGHEVGDDLICETGKLIASVFCTGDIYRIGGDEFAAILRGKHAQDYGEQLISFDQKLALRNARLEPGQELSVAKGASLFYPGADISYLDVFKRADSAMYEDKHCHKQKQ